MSERPGWWRGDLLAAAVVVVAIAVGLMSRDWRTPPGVGRDDRQFSALEQRLDPQRIPKIDRPEVRRRGSPFNDSLTTRAESLCVMRVEANLGTQLRETFTARVTDRYGVGDPETGAGDSLDFDGVALAPSGRVSSWHCGMANLGAYPGSPVVTHTEGK